MSLMDFLKKFSIIIFVVLALIVSHMGISYLTILVVIGLLVSFITGHKKDAVITGVLYALISYILSYPAGLFLAEYMPSTTLNVSADSVTVMSDVIIGALVPSIVAIVICGICAIIGSEISKYVFKKQESTTDEGYHFDMDDYDYDDIDDVNEQEEKEVVNKKRSRKSRKSNKNDLLNLTPIQKAKLKREKNKR